MMKVIKINAPLYFDRCMLIPEWQIDKSNRIEVNYSDRYTRTFFLSADTARKYPIREMYEKKGITVEMRQIPRIVLEENEMKGSLISV